MTRFRTWLRQFRDDESAIGDLARDVLDDPDWPRGRGSLTRYVEHLEEAGAVDDAIATLRAAWERYERSLTA